jgi:hypothetical protein
MRAENRPDYFCNNIGNRAGFCKKKLEFPRGTPAAIAREWLLRMSDFGLTLT